MKILGISGYAGSGKDTVATIVQNYLWAVLDADNIIMAFADSLRGIVAATDATIVDPDRLKLSEVKASKSYVYPALTNRQYMIRVAAALKREFGDDYFTVILANHIQLYECLVIIPDVRYLREKEWIESQGGKVIRIERPGIDMSGAHFSDPSETELASLPPEAFHAIIDNNSTLEELTDKVIDYIHTHLPKLLKQSN